MMKISLFKRSLTSNNNLEKSEVNYFNGTTQLGINQKSDEIDIKNVFRAIARKKKWFFLTAGVIFTGTILFTTYSRIFRPEFKGSFSLLIIDPMSPSGKSSNPIISDSTLFQDIAINESNYKIPTLITLLKSSLFLESIAKEFEISVGSLKKNIQIDQRSFDTREIPEGILNVNLSFNNEKKGLEILETLAESYLKASLEQKQQRLNDGLNFLNKQAPQIQKRKDVLQTKLVSFREKYKLIQPTKESITIKNQQNEIESNITFLNTERERLKDIKEQIKNGKITASGFQKEIGDGLSISDFDQGILKELIRIENELEVAKSKYTSNSRFVKGLNNRLMKIKPTIISNQIKAVEAALNLNNISLQSAMKLRNEIEEKFLKQPALIKEYQEIEQELQIANDNLLSLVSARENFQLEMAQNNIPWKIISRPQMSSKPIKPNIKQNLLFGLLTSLIFGGIIAVIRDQLDNKFNFPEEVKNDLNYPFLGHLPHVDIFKKLREEQTSILNVLAADNTSEEIAKVDSYQKFFFQEAFRNLYTSIRFSDTQNEVKTILLTSSLPKEGKTLTNILLAKTLSDQGVKTLLIDSDMRKPQVHRRLGLNNILGLSNFLIDPKVKLEDITNSIKEFDSLDVITGGTTPPDPTKLLASKKFKNFLKDLKESEKYEIILLDSPPVLGLADSLLVSESVDGVIILIGLGIVKRDFPKETLDRIQIGGANLYGIVTNQTTKSNRELKNKYYNYEGYGYGGVYQPYLAYESYSKDNIKENDSIENTEVEINDINIAKKLKDNLQNIIKKFTLIIRWLDS